MIDIESAVFAAVAGVLREKYSNILVAGEYTDTPARFPAVTIVEIDNSVLQRMTTYAPHIENAASVAYEVNVYTNTQAYKTLEVKGIMPTLDAPSAKLGFTRTMCNPISNLQDAKIFRMVARYEGVVDTSYRIYTN